MQHRQFVWAVLETNVLIEQLYGRNAIIHMTIDKCFYEGRSVDETLRLCLGNLSDAYDEVNRRLIQLHQNSTRTILN